MIQTATATATATATGKLEIIGDVTSTVMTRSFVAARYGRCIC